MQNFNDIRQIGVSFHDMRATFYGLWPLGTKKEGPIAVNYYVIDVASNGRRDYRGVDLRDKLGRQRSPPQRSSLDRDARDRFLSRGHSAPRSGKRSDWNHRKRQRFDGESDFSGSLRTSEGAEHQTRDTKPSSSEFNDVHVGQLKQVQSEIDMLEDHKQQLEIYLEERVQEEDSLNSKIKELEMQLSMEEEECKRISSKIKKFVKANIRHSRIQDELKRSQARLQRLGDQLGLDARAAVNEEDISINILSDEEMLDDHLMRSKNDQRKASPSKEETLVSRLMNPQNDQSKASPIKKRSRVHMLETDEESKQASFTKSGKVTSERHSRWDPHFAQSRNRKETQAEANGISNGRPLVNEDKPTRGKSNFTGILPVDKLEVSGLALPNTTSIAANGVDEVVEAVELDEKLELGLPFSLPPPPPPPVKQNAYLQYRAKDENVEVEFDDEMLDVDIL